MGHGKSFIGGILCVCLIWAATGAVSSAFAETHRIGVLAFRGAEHAVRSWAPTARYLSESIDGAKFEIIPLPLAELRESVAKRKVAFVFTNSGQYVELETDYGISRIATLKAAFGTQVRNVFGAVIFTRAIRKDIRGLKDLKGKSLAAVKRGAFGGFQMAWREMIVAGVDPFSDLSSIKFTGLPQDKIVFAVLRGDVDAGTVRTGVLETMDDEGVIHAGDFHVLNAQPVAGQAVRLSTRLYPEWPFAALPSTPSNLAEKVAIALLSLRPNSPAVEATGFAGWTVPLDYKPVHDLFRDLQIGPYKRGKIGIGEIIEQHWEWALFAFVLLALIGLHGIRTEYLVQRRTRQLSNANRDLEHEILERHRAESRARQHEAELAHVSRISLIGEMTSGLAHELRQPLTAISNYANGGIHRLERQDKSETELGDALKHIAEQATRAGQIISRVRGYMRKREPKREALDLNHAISEAAALLKQDALAHDVSIHLKLAPGLPPIRGDLIEIEQLVINLAKNAIDAIADSRSPIRELHIETENHAGKVRATLRDTGPGLNADDLEAMWTPFFSQKPRGLGLGLAICRTIAETHGGAVWAETGNSSGLSMIFELPEMTERRDVQAAD